MSTIPLAVPKEFLKEFCERNHVRKLSLFGSVLTPRFGPDSDVDVLVEFEAGHVPGLITLAGMEIELSGIFGRKVDMRTPEDLSRYFRSEVVSPLFCNMNAADRIRIQHMLDAAAEVAAFIAGRAAWIFRVTGCCSSLW
jgi:predicted nucleotidyltransferase